MIRKTIIALTAIAALGIVAAPSSDAFAKGFNGPKGLSNGPGPGPTVHPKGPQNWKAPKPGKPGGYHGHHSHGHWGYGVARFGIGVIAGEPDCYRVITRSGRIKTVCTY